MPSLLQRANQCVAAGAVAGLATTILIWIASQSGSFVVLGLRLGFELTPGWIYQRMVWGALWGLLFLLPFFQAWANWRRGLVWGLLPALATMLIFNPFKDQIGFFGLDLGAAMPVVVLVFSLLWGAIAGWWLDLSEFGPGEPEQE